MQMVPGVAAERQNSKARKRRPFCSHAGSCRDLISQSRGALEVALGVLGPMTPMTSQRPGRWSQRSRTRADWPPAVIWPRRRQIQGALPISGSVPRVGQHCRPSLDLSDPALGPRPPNRVACMTREASRNHVTDVLGALRSKANLKCGANINSGFIYTTTEPLALYNET